MARNLSYYKTLLESYLNDTAGSQEAGELFDFIRDEPAAAEALLEGAGGADYWEKRMAAAPVPDTAASDRMRQRLLTCIRTTKPVRKIRPLYWWAAAAVLIVAATAGYLYFMSPAGTKPAAAIVTAQDLKAPSGSRAMITLGNGTQVYLDSVSNGQLAQQGSTRLVKLAGGQLAYESAGNGNGTAVVYNTLINPPGSNVVNLRLSDGTQVWLNTGSSLRYPTAFTGKERQVEITGEAYFEVTHNAASPFVVKKGDAVVNVLGTRFNIKAYDDETDTRVTLLDGAVQVVKGDAAALLQPGEQAIVNHGIATPGAKAVTKAHNVDISAVMAWKNGLFSFNHTNLPAVMRELGRWYNVEIVYEGKMPDLTFGGEITRNSDASQVLKILEESNLHCRIEGRKIIVTP